jgi:hypothetical protein
MTNTIKVTAQEMSAKFGSEFDEFLAYFKKCYLSTTHGHLIFLANVSDDEIADACATYLARNPEFEFMGDTVDREETAQVLLDARLNAQDVK